jgi:hypothetical protein
MESTILKQAVDTLKEEGQFFLELANNLPYQEITEEDLAVCLDAQIGILDALTNRLRGYNTFGQKIKKRKPWTL